ncbi:MAG: hypothetical protein HY902_07935 [Deltaproteobacteria bacterium]|nr:hypothetical protein [Deltaproteobacteria bacterium]
MRRNRLVLLVLTGVLHGAALPGCQAPKPTPLVEAPDPCDPNRDHERCEPSIDGIRQVCDAGTKMWLTVAYCPSGRCEQVADTDAAGADTTSAGRSPAFVAVCVAKPTGSGDTSDGGGSSYWPGTGTANSDAATSETTDSDSTSLACGDGLCGADEGPDSCPADCAPICGDSLCSKGEDASSCAWDCVPGAKAGAQCMIAKCPGGSLQCKPGSACELVLAKVWACAKGCSACLSTCLSQAGADSVVFSVASCSAAACLGSP